MTLSSAMPNLYKDSTGGEQLLNQCDNIEEIVEEIASELSQAKWIGIIGYLRIDPDKLHLVTSANSGDLQRQKMLGLLCWIEDEPKTATFEKLISALVQVDAKSLAGDLRNFWRLFKMRRIRPIRKVESLQTQYYSMQFTQYPQVPKSALIHGSWKLSDSPISHFLYASPIAFFPSKSVPSSSDFDLTSTVSIQGAKLNLLQREAWPIKHVKPAMERPATLSNCSIPTRKRALGNHKRLSQLKISTSIKAAVPLSKNLYKECHPEEVQRKIANKLFDYLLNKNGSKEVLSVIATLESIDGLVIKKLQRGSLEVETNLHKISALRSLIKHFESGKLNGMFQELLISDTALKMAGAFSISLETNIDRKEFEIAYKQLQDKARVASTGRSFNRNSFQLTHRNLSPNRNRNSFKNIGLPTTVALNNRITTMPNSRSVMLDLSPSVRTVRPEPRSFSWRTEKGKGVVTKPSYHPGVIFSVNGQHASLVDDASIEKTINDMEEKDKIEETQTVPPPTPDVQRGKHLTETNGNEEAIEIALDDLNKNTQDVEKAYRYFDNSMLRQLVDLLKRASGVGIESIRHVRDLRKYATILRQNDDAEMAQIIEEYVKVTEMLDQIHRDVMSKIWLKASDNNSASAKPRNSSGSPRRSPLRNRVTQSLEIWRQMQDPEYNFTTLETEEHHKDNFSTEELEKYGGLLSHIPALLASAKACHQLLNLYMHAP